MPIMSFNISDSLKKFLRKMVGNKEYKNNSYVIRDALVRLQGEKDDGVGGAVGAIALENFDPSSLLPKLTSSVLITMKVDSIKVARKINRMELNYHDSIIHKSTFLNKNIRTITYILEDTMDTMQYFITEMNALEDLQSFRYIINEPEE